MTKTSWNGPGAEEYIVPCRNLMARGTRQTSRRQSGDEEVECRQRRCRDTARAVFSVPHGPRVLRVLRVPYTCSILSASHVPHHHHTTTTPSSRAIPQRPKARPAHRAGQRSEQWRCGMSEARAVSAARPARFRFRSSSLATARNLASPPITAARFEVVGGIRKRKRPAPREAARLREQPTHPLSFPMQQKVAAAGPSGRTKRPDD